MGEHHEECSGSTEEKPFTQPRGEIPGGRPSGPARNAEK